MCAANATTADQDELTEFVTGTPINVTISKLQELAINCLNTFYTLALLDSAPKTESTAAQRIYANMGGEISAAARRIVCDGYLSFLTGFDCHRRTKA